MVLESIQSLPHCNCPMHLLCSPEGWEWSWRKLSHLAINKRIRLILRVEPFVKGIPSRMWAMHVRHAVYKILLTVYVCVCVYKCYTDRGCSPGFWLLTLWPDWSAPGVPALPSGPNNRQKKISSLTKIYVPALSLTSPPPPQPEAHTRSAIQARLLH